jgi:hypothetical protein
MRLEMHRHSLVRPVLPVTRRTFLVFLVFLLSSSWLGHLDPFLVHLLSPLHLQRSTCPRFSPDSFDFFTCWSVRARLSDLAMTFTFESAIARKFVFSVATVDRFSISRFDDLVSGLTIQLDFHLLPANRHLLSLSLSLSLSHLH